MEVKNFNNTQRVYRVPRSDSLGSNCIEFWWQDLSSCTICEEVNSVHKIIYSICISLQDIFRVLVHIGIGFFCSSPETNSQRKLIECDDSLSEQLTQSTLGDASHLLHLPESFLSMQEPLTVESHEFIARVHMWNASLYLSQYFCLSPCILQVERPCGYWLV